MRLLEWTKCSLLFCLGLCIISYLFIYLRTGMSKEPQHQQPQSCRPFSKGCKAFLPEMKKGKQWYRRDCQVTEYVQNNSLQCSHLINSLHFITSPLSQAEEEYPLAFIVTIHKELELFVRMLRAIYMPQNIYCIHVDAKAPMEYRTSVQKLVSCFQNVFLSSRSETVTYAGFSRLRADLNCMEDLVKFKQSWRKVVNLCGQDFPVKSNLELVQYLQSKEWKDRNMTPGVKQPASMRHRTLFHHREIKGSHVATHPGRKKDPPPHNLQIYFGTAYYALTKDFVVFILNSPIAQDLLEWSKDTFSPDEHYFVTLNHIEEAPGSYIEGEWAGAIRAIKWRDQEKDHGGCNGRYVRDICIYGFEDLPWIIKKDGIFANKFESETCPEALDCLEQWHRNKVLNQATVPIEPSWLLAVQSN